MLFERSYEALMCCDPLEKQALVMALAQDWRDDKLTKKSYPVQTVTIPGRPDKPELVPPRALAKRKLGSSAGQAALIHALAHIEFNAINLALDAVYRFQSMPDAYYTDWLKVACEEAYHHHMLADHLKTLDYTYGDFPAHNGLWEMAIKTEHDVLVRIALVPRLMEARGLDVTPSIMKKLKQIGDTRAVEILSIIERDEISHVKIGNHWFNTLCQARAQCPLATFKDLLTEFGCQQLKPPFAHATRQQAGFTAEELAILEDMAALTT